MKRLIVVTGALCLLTWTASCTDDASRPESPLAPPVVIVGNDDANPVNVAGAVVPEATVPLISAPAFAFPNVVDGGTIAPASVYAVLPVGGSFTEHKDVYLPAGILPDVADIMFAFDLTGSMGGELSNAKNNSSNIMTTLAGAIDDARFGVVSHMDYPASYSGCGYSGTYGDAFYGDYPYNLDEPLTATVADVASAITGLLLGYGADTPEDYTRVLWEAYNDTGILWRTDAARFLVYWQDAIPHDCSLGTGPDPGRNGTVGTADDLVLATTLQGLADAGVTLVSLHSGGWNASWDAWASETGGSSFQINSDGTIPGGVDIADFILQKLQEVSQDIDELELRPSAGFEAWAASDPIYDVNLAETNDFDFDVAFTVPGDASAGIYTFQVCVFADGAPLGVCQDVQIVVYDPSAGFVTGGGWIDSAPGAYYPMGLSFFEGSYYELVMEYGMTWDDANAAAEAAAVPGCTDAHLVTITSQEEQDALYSFFDGELQGKWYGGYQNPGELDPAAGWNWVTSEPWDYTNWAAGEPNDAYGPGTEPHLIGWSDGWAWNDEGNLGSVTGYVIEYEGCLTGKATFGFVAKYKKGQSTPDGNTEFQFHAADLNFHSTAYDWLVINQHGTNAQFKGVGTINGMGDYKFMLWAGDDDPDTFRIKIWTEDAGTGEETVVYDNGGQPIDGGSIVSHTK